MADRATLPIIVQRCSNFRQRYALRPTGKRAWIEFAGWWSTATNRGPPSSSRQSPCGTRHRLCSRLPLSNTAASRCIYMLHTETTNKRGADLNNVSSNSVRAGRGATFLPLFYYRSNPPPNAWFFLSATLSLSRLVIRTLEISSRHFSSNCSEFVKLLQAILEFIVTCVCSMNLQKSSVSRKSNTYNPRNRERQIEIS